MSFGNFQLQQLAPSQRQEPSQGYALGHSFQRRGRLGRDTQSTGQTQPVQTSSEGYSGKSKTDLTVVTGEGDRVTISLAAQVQYAASSKTGPGGSSQSVFTSSSSQLNIAVEGDLNETELKDLSTLLGNLAKVTQAAQSSGQQLSAAAPATPNPDTGFSGLTSLAAFAYSYKQTVEAGSFVSTRG